MRVSGTDRIGGGNHSCKMCVCGHNHHCAPACLCPPTTPHPTSLRPARHTERSQSRIEPTDHDADSLPPAQGFVKAYAAILASAADPGHPYAPFRTVLEHLASPTSPPSPVLVHCTAGKDSKCPPHPSRTPN